MSRPKFQVQQRIMDFTSKTSYIADETSCDKHKADKGSACWYLTSSAGNTLRAICSSRTKKLFNGAITASARTARPNQGVRK